MTQVYDHQRAKKDQMLSNSQIKKKKAEDSKHSKLNTDNSVRETKGRVQY